MGKLADDEWSPEDLVGGHPALDFVNTAGCGTKARDLDRLLCYEDVLKWCAVSKVLSADEVAGLNARAAAAPVDADQILHDLRRFREALHACLIAEQAAQPWPRHPGEHVEKLIRVSLDNAHLERTERCYRWSVTPTVVGLSLPLMRLALSAEQLLRSDDLSRLGNCDRCSWLFIDRSRGRPRRWCSMATCGSRAKSARYYRRRKS